MLEINRLYGVIGRCEQELDELEHQHADEVEAAQTQGKIELKLERVPKSNYVKGGIGVAAVLALYVVYRKFR